jgi:hypothetical protein
MPGICARAVSLSGTAGCRDGDAQPSKKASMAPGIAIRQVRIKADSVTEPCLDAAAPTTASSMFFSVEMMIVGPSAALPRRRSDQTARGGSRYSVIAKIR